MARSERCQPASASCLVHGFTQTGAVAGRPVDAPARERDGVRRRRARPRRLVDRGRRPVGAARSGRTAGAAAGYLGYSMGGRIGLHLALAHPAVDRLVLVGATAGIEDPVDRATRASRRGPGPAGSSSGGVEAFLERWLASPLFAGLAAERSRHGGPRWPTPPAGLAVQPALARHRHPGRPLWARLAELTMPVLVVAGERDAQVRRPRPPPGRGIGANGRLALVAGAGHACHLERPDAFVGARPADFLAVEASAVPAVRGASPIGQQHAVDRAAAGRCACSTATRARPSSRPAAPGAPAATARARGQQRPAAAHGRATARARPAERRAPATQAA